METKAWVPLQQARAAPRTRTERERDLRNLHVKGSTSQPSRVAEGREQTTKVRKCHREHSGRASALKKLYLNQPHESLFKQRDLAKIYWKNHKWTYCIKQPFL